MHWLQERVYREKTMLKGRLNTYREHIRQPELQKIEHVR